MAWVYDHGTVRTYMNGEWVHDSVVGAATSPAVNDLRLGGRRRDDQCFEGLLDEVTLYDGVLSPLEIRAVCDADSAGKCLPLHPGTTTLAIAAVGGDVVLSWPAGQSEYILEATPDLASPEGWARVTAPAAVVGDLIRVIVHPHAGQQFFRLRTDAGTGGDSPPGRR